MCLVSVTHFAALSALQLVSNFLVYIASLGTTSPVRLTYRLQVSTYLVPLLHRSLLYFGYTRSR